MWKKIKGNAVSWFVWVFAWAHFSYSTWFLFLSYDNPLMGIFLNFFILGLIVVVAIPIPFVDQRRNLWTSPGKP